MVKTAKLNSNIVKKNKPTIARKSKKSRISKNIIKHSSPPPPPPSHFPYFVLAENTLNRNIVILPYTTSNDCWDNKIIFYKSSGLSNNTEDKTGGTWFPILGMVNNENREFINSRAKNIKTNASGKDEESDYILGYLMKMSLIYQMKNRENKPTELTLSSANSELRDSETQPLLQRPKPLYYSSNVNLFIKNYVDTIEEESELIELFNDDFIIKLNTYFYEENQVIMSIWWDENANLWINRNHFKNYVKKLPYYQDLCNQFNDKKMETMKMFSNNEPGKNDKEFHKFIIKNNFPRNYPEDIIKCLLEKTEFTQQTNVLKIRADKSRKFQIKKSLSRIKR